MSEFDALLANVLAHPEDDLPRLILADWLDETGEPAHAARAHFIRLQVSAAALPIDSPERRILEKHADDLLDLYGHGWNDIRFDERTGQDPIPGAVFRRGFIDEAVMSLSSLARHGYLLFSREPIRKLTLIPPSARTQPNAPSSPSSPQFDRLPNLARLVSLHLTWWRYEHDPCERVLEWFDSMSAFNHLVHFAITDCLLNDAECVTLTRLLSVPDRVPRLCELDLSNNPISDQGAAALSALRDVDRLQRLDMTGTQLTEAGRNLLRSRFGERVRFE